MPMQLLRRIGVVVNVDRDRQAFLKAKQWPRNCPLQVAVEMIRLGAISTGDVLMCNV